MNEIQITYACPQCEQAARQSVTDQTKQLVCNHCGATTAVPENAWQNGQMTQCLTCPSRELFVRKDFPQRLGVTIVCAGLAASCVPWYFHNWLATFAILFATALVDVILYVMVGNVVQCYRCQSQYRGDEDLATHPPFDLVTHERHRQQAARKNFGLAKK